MGLVSNINKRCLFGTEWEYNCDKGQGTYEVAYKQILQDMDMDVLLKLSFFLKDLLSAYNGFLTMSFY